MLYKAYQGLQEFQALNCQPLQGRFKIQYLSNRQEFGNILNVKKYYFISPLRILQSIGTVMERFL